MPSKILRIATRKSPLALWQAHYIRDQLLKQDPTLNIELLPMKTSGDAFLKDALSSLGGKGLFVKELEEALLDKRADLAVHSMKDVPVTFPEGLCLAAICERQNPFDALVSHHATTLNTLPQGAIIGTTSLRRQSQLLAARPDLQMKTLRGNLQTRLNKLATEAYDAIILAVAGLQRMGLDNAITEMLPADIMLPACGQGALGIECRSDDHTLLPLLQSLNDPISALCVHCERHVNAKLGGNCHVPLAVYCTYEPDNELLLRAKVATADGTRVITHCEKGPQSQATALADQCAQVLLQNGAAELLNTAL